jgi:ubiquinone biosynthesis UbiH/UbiF/VisC/COQ6 family hydroxylase
MSSGCADYDAIVLGGGPVGLALAAALARESLAVALIERSSLTTFDAPAGTDDWDSRVYAVSPGSAEFLRGIGVWQRLPAERVTPIETMDVRGDGDGAIAFSAYELGERALAWIVEHRALCSALLESVRGSRGIELLAPCEPAAVAWRSDAALLSLADGRTLSARLLAGADGVRSWLRREAGIAREPQPYAQTAVVANFGTERAHRGRAFQWFIDGAGVLAWLPLPGRRISIVWSAPNALARELAALDAKALATRVAEAGGNALGELSLITPPASFPLSYLKLSSVVARRVALVGDAAHGVHPLAGQGVNLGFGDAAALASVLGAGRPLGDAGAPLLLERYARKRAWPVLAMQLVTDGLVHLFEPPALKRLRNSGMRAVAVLAPVRRLLAQPALR